MQTHQIQKIYEGQDIKVSLILVLNQNSYKSKTMCSYAGNIQPVSVVINKSGETTAFDMQAEEMSIEELGATFPDLNKRLR